MAKRAAERPERAEFFAMAKCIGRGITGIRNIAALVVLYRCGLRASELSDLSVKDVQLDRHLVVVREGKGDKSRIVGLDLQSVPFIERWLAEREKHPKIKLQSPLFCTLKGTRVHRNYWLHLIKRLADRAGVAKTLNTHGFRHSYALDFLEDGNDLEALREMLGHSSLRTTQVYLRRRHIEHVLDRAKERTWINDGQKSGS